MSASVKVTEQHIALLRRMRFDWDDEIEFGCICTDPKRPFGNSDVNRDVEAILNLPEDSVSWDDALAITIPLSAIVDHLLKTADLDALIGTELTLPWRAERALR